MLPKVDWKKVLEHAALVAAVALVSDVVAHIPVVDGGFSAILVLALKALVDDLKTVV